ATAATSSTPATHTVSMTGAQETPKGSPTGKGTFKYQLVTKTSMLCYSLKWSGIGTPYASHVHKGVKGVEGPVVIPLSATSPVAKSGCVKVKKSLLAAIAKKPSNYYVNVHTKKYPGGALRGQL
ncbi:MAG TPA: CHRD domain-containing protein, partial [Solirubrobacteraceae bacterium]|nr:CHRD domain-containing protein [Solirubrobacteraceae bacterium]